MDYDLGYFDPEARVWLEPLENPFGPKVLSMSSVRSVTHVSGLALSHGPPSSTVNFCVATSSKSPTEIAARDKAAYRSEASG